MRREAARLVKRAESLRVKQQERLNERLAKRLKVALDELKRPPRKRATEPKEGKRVWIQQQCRYASITRRPKRLRSLCRAGARPPSAHQRLVAFIERYLAFIERGRSSGIPDEAHWGERTARAIHLSETIPVLRVEEAVERVIFGNGKPSARASGKKEREEKREYREKMLKASLRTARAFEMMATSQVMAQSKTENESKGMNVDAPKYQCLRAHLTEGLPVDPFGGVVQQDYMRAIAKKLEDPVINFSTYGLRAVVEPFSLAALCCGRFDLLRFG